MSDSKKPWESSTVWVNVAVAAGTALWEQVAGGLDPELVAAGIALLNVFLRFRTKKAVSL